MINLYVQKLMILAFSVWHPEKAECFSQHMDPLLTQVKLKNWQVDHWASMFDKSMLYKEYLATKYIISDELLKLAEEKNSDSEKES